MRIDVVSIFPEYFTPLELSLAGKARDKGLLDLTAHDLRRWTHDRHRTVDDTPYGGGAGMVMRPEPWGEALDALAGPDTLVVVPTPSGEPFTQAIARELAAEPHLVFACGRYEGIDQRVIDYARDMGARDIGAPDTGRVRELSLGDYVLNGGEVATLAVIEAVARLLPGFLGNPDSLVEESHGDERLLEYPAYTKPPVWRGREVPPVLLSGDHGAIAAWRRRQALARTVERRPDLAPPSRIAAVGGLQIVPAVPADAGEILTLQRACWVQEALANDLLDLPPLRETLDDVRAGIDRWATYVVRHEKRLVGSVRGRLEGTAWEIGRIMVAPDFQGRGLGRALLEHICAVAPAPATSYRLFTGARSTDNLRMYKKSGFSVRGPLADDGRVVVLTRSR
ncbi:MAG: tRNA (guanosine(37)-N1)-methyltransferase TrmD [Nocardioidaceae bacterium]